MVNRQQQIERHNRNVREAMAAARRGETICLTALMGGAEQVVLDDIEQRGERGESVYSDDWRVRS